MIDRRDLLMFGVSAPVALGIRGVLRAATDGIDLWVKDDRYRASLSAIAWPRAETVIGGDVTKLWTGLLDDAWRQPGFIVAGTTGSDALFVLEQLAWGRGRRVVERTEIAPRTANRPALVRWRIAPSHPSTKA